MKRIFVIFIVACGGSSHSTGPGPVATVSVAPAAASVAAGAMQSFAAAARDAGGNAIGGAATWQTSDPTIATVDANGVATGLKAGGPVTVTATVSGVQGSASLTVIPAGTTHTLNWGTSIGGTSAANLTIALGDSVEWNNIDSGGIYGGGTTHTASGCAGACNTSAAGTLAPPPNTGDIGPGATSAPQA